MEKSVGTYRGESELSKVLFTDSYLTTPFIRIDYPAAVIGQTNSILKYGINDQAVKRYFHEGITIDGVDSLDLDDAIWIEKLKNGGYVLFVHISDVTEAIKQYTPIDNEALKRGTSIYREEGVINMIPPQLSENLLSLNDNGDKLTLSLQAEFDRDGNVVKFNFFESKFRNLRRYNYEDFLDDYLNPESQNHKTLHLMYEFASLLRAKRKIEGADLDFKDSDRQLSLGKKQEEKIVGWKSIPKIIIEEIMISANKVSAMYCINKGFNSIFRLHDSLDERAYYTNHPGLHTGLATNTYSHFTSPIRRYPDDIVHRVIKIMGIRGELLGKKDKKTKIILPPYSSSEIKTYSSYSNFTRELIEDLGSDTKNELKGEKLVKKTKLRNGGHTTTSDYTQSLRYRVSKGKKIPKAVVREFINDIINGHKGKWGWAVGVFLMSNDKDLISSLRKAVIEDNKFSPKSFIAQLRETRAIKSDRKSFFEIRESMGDVYSTVVVYYKGLKIAESRHKLKHKGSRGCIGIARKKALMKVFDYFEGI